MVSAIDLVLDSLKKSFDLGLWLCFLLVSFLNIVVFFLSIGLTMIPAFAIYELFKFSQISFLLWGILLLLGFVLLLYISSVYWAMLLFIAKNFVEKGKIILDESWNSALARASQLFLATIITCVFFFIVLAIFFIPVAMPLSEPFSKAIVQEGLSAETLIPPILTSIVLLVAVIMAFFFFTVIISPFTVLIAPAVVFESSSTLNSIKKAVVAIKKNYFHNLFTVILYSVISTIISAFFFLIIGGFSGFIVPFSGMDGFPIARMTMDVLSFILKVFSAIILMAFSSIFSYNYYKENFFEEPKPKKKKENPLEEEPEKPGDYGIPSEKETTSVKLEPWMGKRI